MYGDNNSSNDLPYDFSGDFPCHFPLPDVSTPANLSSSSTFPPYPLVIPSNEFDSVSALMKQEFCYTTSSGCSSYDSPSSHTSYGSQSSSLMQRSVSSHSLHKNVSGFLFQQPAEFVDSDSSPVRKVLSTGDLPRINMLQHNHRSDQSPLSNESSSSIIEGINSKACRYSPEEKRERIERYRSKRSQRNFDKKIKYVCRKTLADSRPRIRGRFARNEEIEKAPQNEWNHISVDEDLGDDIDENWINFVDAFNFQQI